MIKKQTGFLLLLLLVGAEAPAQSNAPSVFGGLGAVAVNVREIDLYNSLLQKRRGFKGGGVFVGGSFGIRKHLYVELSFTPFKGSQLAQITAIKANYFELKGFQVPISINRLVTGVFKKFDMSLGAGVNLIKANVKQYDDKGGKMLDEVNVFTPTIAAFTSFRWRLSQKIEFDVNLNASVTPRLAGTVALAFRYNFAKKESSTNHAN